MDAQSGTLMQFETGERTYHLNGKFDLTVNPTDSFFVERLFSTFDGLDARQESYKREIEKLGDKREIFAIARKRDAEMREMVDSVLGEGCCAAVFGSMNVFALGGGLPVWANLLLAVIDEIDTTFAREQKATNPRLEKYLKKYRK